MSKRFRTILRGLDYNFTQLKTSAEHDLLEKFHNPKKRGLPDPLIIPAENNSNFTILINQRRLTVTNRFMIISKTQPYLSTIGMTIQATF